VNFLGQDDDDPRRKALAAYGPSKLDRLIALKRKYDPDNVFRINHNIAPDRWDKTAHAQPPGRRRRAR